jgi:hypothetical protein
VAVPVPRWGRVIRSAVAMMVTWCAMVAVSVQLFASGSVFPWDHAVGASLWTLWWAWGLAAMFAVLGSVSTAVLVVDVRTGFAASSMRRDPMLGAALVIAAGVGVGVAAVLALVCAQFFGIDPVRPLAWTLLSTIPVAVAVAAAGAAISRTDPTVVAWRDRVREPLAALVLSATSTAALVTAEGGVPRIAEAVTWNVEHLGGFGVGWALACLLVSNGWYRMVVGFPVALVCTVVVGAQTVLVLTAALFAAYVLWWVRRVPAAARRRPAS